MAVLNSLNCLTPNPPYSFRKQIVSQLTQGIFLESSHPPQKKLFKRELMEEIILAGALKKERAYTGRDVKTDLRRTSRPPKEKKRFPHPDSLLLMRANTGSQKPRRLGSPPIGRPR
ncbi:hypothetical protein QL285_096039 [Trifolium repens]|nr:hypothetical protein QL285_096039 [Trifolium repens]